MQDLQAALGGGGQDAGGYGVPPPDADAQEDAQEGPEQYSTSLDALDGAENALHQFIQLDPDEADRAVAATCLQNIIKLKAKNQSDSQGGGMTSLARALQGGSQGGGY